MGEHKMMVWEVTQLCVVWDYMRPPIVAQFWILKKLFLAQFIEYDTDIVLVVGEFLHDNKGEHKIMVWEVTQLCVVWHYMRAAHMAQFGS